MRILDLVVLIPGGLLSAMLIWLIWVLPVMRDMRDRKIIRRAQNLALGDGVTLLQGIRAYFGEDGTWGVWGNWVQVFMGEPEIVFHIEIVPIDGEADKLELHVLDHDRVWVSEEEAEEVLSLLVEAVKRQKKTSG